MSDERPRRFSATKGPPTVPEREGETAISEPKADYVLRQRQTRSHECHWPGCGRQVPPAMWGCKTHWYALPGALRARIWRTYKPGQEITMTPSAEYIEAAKAVQTWIRESGKQP